MLVRASQSDAAQFLLLVWVGDELKSQTPTQVLSPRAYRERGGKFGASGWSGMLTKVAIGGGLLLLAAVLYGFLRKFRRAA